MGICAGSVVSETDTVRSAPSRAADDRTVALATDDHPIDGDNALQDYGGSSAPDGDGERAEHGTGMAPEAYRTEDDPLCGGAGFEEADGARFILEADGETGEPVRLISEAGITGDDTSGSVSQLDSTPDWDSLGHTLDLSRLLAGLSFRAGSDLLSDWLNAVSDGHDAIDQAYEVSIELNFDAVGMSQGLEDPVSPGDHMTDHHLLIG